MSSTLTITLDERTRAALDKLSATDGVAASEMAARLLKRAVRAARPRPVWDVEQLRRYAQENAAEELALAERSGPSPGREWPV